MRRLTSSVATLARFLPRLLSGLLLIGLIGAVWLAGSPTAAPAWADWTVPRSFSNAELSGQNFAGQELQGSELSNAHMERTNFEAADLRGAVFSASVLTQANLHGADLTNALADQVNFSGADLSDALLVETLLLRSTFDQAEITGADFSDALLDRAQVKQLCQSASGVNSKTGIETRASLGCR